MCYLSFPYLVLEIVTCLFKVNLQFSRYIGESASSTRDCHDLVKLKLTEEQKKVRIIFNNILLNREVINFWRFNKKNISGIFRVLNIPACFANLSRRDRGSHHYYDCVEL